MKYVFYPGVMLTMLSFLVGCSSFGYRSPRYVKLAAEITEKTSKKLEEEKKLILFGTGGQMMDDIQVMDMGLQYFHEVDLQIARELILYAVNEYLKEINANTEIQQYLHEVPFTAKNVEIVIYFHKPDRHDVSPGKISIVAERRGQVVYFIDNVEKNTLDTLYEETYEEAMKKVSSE